MIKLSFFHFQVANSKLKKIHFDLVIRKVKKENLDLELWSLEIPYWNEIYNSELFEINADILEFVIKKIKILFP